MNVHAARWLVPVATPPVRDGAVAVDADGRIVYVGPAIDAPPGERHALGDAALLPGLVAADAADRVVDDADRIRFAACRAAGVTTLATTGDARDSVARAGLRLLTHVGVGPAHAIDEDLLIDRCAWAVGERLPIAIRAGAGPDEVAYLREAAGPLADARRAAGFDVVRRAHSTVHLLAELGVAAVARPLLIGGAWFDESDVALAAYYDCAVAYVPPDAPAPCPLTALVDARVRTALAFGGAFLATAHALTRTPADAIHLVTLGGARALGVDAEVGSLESGKAADVCAFTLTAEESAIADAHGPEHAIVARPDRRAAFSMVHGRMILERNS